MAPQERLALFVLLFEVEGKSQESRDLGPGRGPHVTSAASLGQFLYVIYYTGTIIYDASKHG